MIIKTFEIRDSGTFIPAIAIRIDRCLEANDKEALLISRAGYGDEPLVLLTRLDGGKSCYDPYDWGDRTWHVAHKYIADNWDFLRSGDVIDVEFILGETERIKLSERIRS
jgi:hypothetical protein